MCGDKQRGMRMAHGRKNLSTLRLAKLPTDLT